MEIYNKRPNLGYPRYSAQYAQLYKNATGCYTEAINNYKILNKTLEVDKYTIISVATLKLMGKYVLGEYNEVGMAEDVHEFNRLMN
jgi:hypothetical protein